jgi:CHAT domain-containing protein/tetratricopeptide (TPR) repeat protein
MALHGRSQALAQLEQARATGSTERLRALSWIQESVVHVAVQDWPAALAALARVDLPEPDEELLTPAERTAGHINAGLAHLSLLELGPARDQLERALQLSLAHGLTNQEFKARHNLGCLEYYAGNLPEAIGLMQQADALDADVDRGRAVHDLALVLLEAGLLDQARDMLLRALGMAQEARHRLAQADLRLDLATCALLADDTTTARGHLGAALAAYRARGATERQRSTALLRAFVDLSEGRLPRGIDRVLAPWLAAGRAVTPDERLAARLHVEALLLRGDVAGAAAAVGRLTRSARQGFAAEMHERLLRARVAAARGDRRAARRTVRAAMDRLAERQAPSQSLEIRAALSLHGQRLADFDTREALATGSAVAFCDAVERWRAVSHRLPPVVASVDERSAGLLAELRQARRALGEPGSDDAALRARVTDLEWRVSQLDWAAPERETLDTVLAPVTHATVRDLLASRGEQALVMVAQEGRQYAVTITSRGTSLHELGASAEVAAIADQFVRDLQAQAFSRTNPALSQAVGRAVAQSRDRLDARLLSTLELDDDRALVIVPGRTLQAVPWGMLPGLTGRPVTVAPSLTRWAAPLLVTERSELLTATVLTGPRLRRAVAESEAVAAAWAASAAVRHHPAADAADLKQALRRATVVHVAAHGTHEPQNPWFSALHVGDGPVFAHELPRPVTSRHVVLSSCDLGRSTSRPGEEPLGLTAALLGLGVRCVVAAVAPVGDEAAERAMVAYHRGLVGGRSASQALADAVAEHPDAAAFCLFGTDWTPSLDGDPVRGATRASDRQRAAQIQSAGSRNIAS